MEKKKLIIIDDEEDIVELLSIRLKASGFEVYSHRDGMGAVDAVRKFGPDLIILDLRLPNLNGEAIFKKLKEDPKLKLIPVIFFSASITKKDHCLDDLHADSFVTKPYNPADLVKTIKDILKLN